MRYQWVALLALAPMLTSHEPVASRVYRWKDAVVEERVGRIDRPLFSGSTLDLESLEIHATTLLARSAPDSSDEHRDTELFLMVKEGTVRVAIAGSIAMLGAGSVAMALPGDRLTVTNSGTAPATYYLFTYRSRAPMDLQRGRQSGGSFIIDRLGLATRSTGSGTRRDVFNRPTAMFRRFEGHFSSVNQGLRNHATHSHRAEEIMMFVRGQADVLIDRVDHPASAGDLAFLGTMTQHSLANSGRGSTEYLVIQGE